MKNLVRTTLTFLAILAVMVSYSPILQAAKPATAVGVKGIPPSPAPLPGGTLDPLTISKFVQPLTVPGVMPRTSGGAVDYYEIAVKQFQQQVLPVGLPSTTVWGYGSLTDPASFSYPARTIEAQYNQPVRVKWVNGLVDATGNYLPHILPVDQTLHWANPPGGVAERDMQGMDPAPYTGPVPLVTHLHGAHVGEESDGFPKAWYLPAANNIPAGYATVGSEYDRLKAKAEAAYGQPWLPGTAVYQYPNDQRAATLWYHDHTMGMTRNNVDAGLLGLGTEFLRAEVMHRVVIGHEDQGGVSGLSNLLRCEHTCARCDAILQGGVARLPDSGPICHWVRKRYSELDNVASCRCQ